jgi:aminopeptidase N
MSQESVNPIPGSYRSLVYCTAIRDGGVKEWSFASEQYRKETDANQKNDLQSGMSCTRIGYLLTRFLNDQLDKDIVRVQDTITGIRQVAAKADGYLRAWNFVKENWGELFLRYLVCFIIFDFCNELFFL